MKDDLKESYQFFQEVNDAELELEKDFNEYLKKYIEPLEQLITRKEKLQMQVVPYITNGFWQKFKAFFSYEGRAKLTIEKQFNKELKNVEKEIKQNEIIKQKNYLNFDNREDEVYKKILENIDIDLINQSLIISKEQKNEFISSLKISKNIVIKNQKMSFLKKISEYKTARYQRFFVLLQPQNT